MLFKQWAEWESAGLATFNFKGLQFCFKCINVITFFITTLPSSQIYKSYSEFKSLQLHCTALECSIKSSNI